jgi:hypothetical protein
VGPRPNAENQLIVQQNLWHAVGSGKRAMVKRAVEDDGADINVRRGLPSIGRSHRGCGGGKCSRPAPA